LENSQGESKGHVRSVLKDFVMKPMYLMANCKATVSSYRKGILTVVCGSMSPYRNALRRPIRKQEKTIFL
jgi:hypothetical protein